MKGLDVKNFDDLKEVFKMMADLKKVYAAVDEQTALAELDTFDE